MDNQKEIETTDATDSAITQLREDRAQLIAFLRAADVSPAVAKAALYARDTLDIARFIMEDVFHDVDLEVQKVFELQAIIQREVTSLISRK